MLRVVSGGFRGGEEAEVFEGEDKEFFSGDVYYESRSSLPRA